MARCISSATRPDTKGRLDIYRARWQNGAFAPPENLGEGVNTTFGEVDPYVAPDQSFVVFSATGRPDDLGGGDLYISEQANGAFGPARHLGAGINSVAREYCPIGSPDGRYFFFTSFRGFGDRIPDRPLDNQGVSDRHAHRAEWLGQYLSDRYGRAQAAVIKRTQPGHPIPDAGDGDRLSDRLSDGAPSNSRFCGVISAGIVCVQTR